MAALLFSRSDFRVAAKIGVISIGFSVVIAVAWALLAPRPQIEIHEGKVRLDAYTESFVAADLTLGLLCIGAGLIVTVIALIKWRERLYGVLIGCTVSGLLGSVLAWRIGVQLTGGSHDDHALGVDGRADGTVFDGPISLDARGILLLWPIVACLVITIFSGIQASRSRRILRANSELAARNVQLGPSEP